MNPHLTAVAQKCLAGAENNTMTFPEIIGTLLEYDFEGYAVDYRRHTTTYYLSNGESIALESHKTAAEVAPSLDVTSLTAAIREAQALLPGYTYKGFCLKAKAAGCAGYLVSFPGKRAVYYGRTGETHVEYFPK